LRVEAMAAPFKFRTEVKKVKDLAVEYNPGAAVFVENGLVSTGKIDDTETPHSQPSPICDIDALIVRTAMDDLVAHMAHQSFRNVALPGCANHSCHSAHVLFLSFYNLRTRAPLPRSR